jgi:hypothetical protein
VKLISSNGFSSSGRETENISAVPNNLEIARTPRESGSSQSSNTINSSNDIIGANYKNELDSLISSWSVFQVIE